MSILENRQEKCQYFYGDMALASLPDARLAMPFRKRWWALKRDVWYISILGPFGFASRMFPATTLGKIAFKDKQEIKPAKKRGGSLKLKIGDWVEILSQKEIFATLDAQGKLKGLRFTREMVPFCGKKVRVYRVLDKMIMEATGELRRLKTPMYLLEGVLCDGSAHGGCDKSCFPFWRSEWLRQVP